MLRRSLKKLKEINATKEARHFDSFDFSTQYTNIPQDLLLDSISQLIREAYLVLQSNGTAYWQTFFLLP